MTFKDIPWLEWRYEISYEWFVRNAKTQQVLKPFLRWKYLSISVRINGKKKNFNIHILVAKTHKERPRPYRKYCIVNHLDLDKFNNHWDNLEWETCAWNTQHYFKNKCSNCKI